MKPAHDDEIFVTEIVATVPNVGVSLYGTTVRVNLVCENEYYARVLYDDLSERVGKQRLVVQFGGGTEPGGTIEEEVK